MVAGADDISSNSVRAIETGGHSETDSRGDSGGNQKPLQTVGFESDCDPVSGDEIKMREGGLEPPIPFGNQILNLARLPIPPLSLLARGQLFTLDTFQLRSSGATSKSQV